MDQVCKLYASMMRWAFENRDMERFKIMEDGLLKLAETEQRKSA